MANAELTAKKKGPTEGPSVLLAQELPQDAYDEVRLACPLSGLREGFFPEGVELGRHVTRQSDVQAVLPGSSLR